VIMSLSRGTSAFREGVVAWAGQESLEIDRAPFASDLDPRRGREEDGDCNHYRHQ
jgi:hypothetical protein